MTESSNIIKPPESVGAPTKKMIIFSMGFFLNVYLTVAFNNYVWTFYEGELGIISMVPLWPIYMALANVVFTIWNMINDPLVGYLTDKPKKWTKKRGFHTPWIIIGGIPTIILFFFIFTPPNVSGLDSIFFVLIYYLLIICIYDLFYSLFQTHAYGAFPAHFRGDATRRKASAWTQIFTFLANFFAIMVWSQIIIPGNASTFTTAAFISLIIMFISLIIFLPGARESEEIKDRFILGYDTAEKIPFFKTMKMALKQKNFMLSLITYLLFTIAYGLISMNAVNFVDDVLGEPQTIRTLGSIILFLSSLLTMPLWALVAKKIGHSQTYAIGLALCGVSYLFNLFIGNAIEYYLVQFFSGVAAAMFFIMIQPILADCYDEVAVQTGKHHESTLLGIRNFFFRASFAIQGFIVAIIHVVTMYNPISQTHGVDAIIGLRIIQGLFPFIFCIMGALIFIKWFDMKGKKKQEILDKLHEMGL